MQTTDGSGVSDDGADDVLLIRQHRRSLKEINLIRLTATTEIDDGGSGRRWCPMLTAEAAAVDDDDRD